MPEFHNLPSWSLTDSERTYQRTGDRAATFWQLGRPRGRPPGRPAIGLPPNFTAGRSVVGRFSEPLSQTIEFAWTFQTETLPKKANAPPARSIACFAIKRTGSASSHLLPKGGVLPKGRQSAESAPGAERRTGWRAVTATPEGRA